jgi:hypothetical protein
MNKSKRTLANPIIICFASSKRPVTKRSPRNAMNVSLPQARMNPVEKCGKPAAIVTDNGGEYCIT